ncbi:MAG: Mur ligase family protein [Bifidobacteriaceae bacterium]|nr:Mur ligase family protein [Bifidobacteriaceae bacterium]
MSMSNDVNDTNNRRTTEALPARPLATDDSLAAIDDPAQLGTVFFSGIGGSGMSVLACMLHQFGVPVAGSDRVESSSTRQLENLGIPVTIGQKANNVDDVDTVVWSSAIPANALEMLEARHLRKRLAHRSDILALLLRVQHSIAVAGTHGKTTTSSLIATILQTTGKEPSFAIGGSLKTLDGIVSGGHVGTGQWIVAEADESDGSFRKYRPTIVVITNAEGDHLDHYGTIARYRAAFKSFAGQAQQAIVLCGDDEGAREVYNHLPQDVVDRTIVYATTPFDELSALMPGLDASRFAFVGSASEISVSNDCHRQELEDATITAMDSNRNVIVDEGIQETFALVMPPALLNGDALTLDVSLKVPGIHNARNASAAILASVLTGVDPIQAAAGAVTFLGTARRFDFQGNVGGVRLYTDYAHHPTEIATFLSAIRRRFPGATVRVLFQPHTYSRTRTFAAELVDALSQADAVYLSRLYAARENASDYPGVSSQTLIEEAKHCGVGDRFVLINDKSAAALTMARDARPGDILATVGGGDINLVDPLILQELRRLEEQRAAQRAAHLLRSGTAEQSMSNAEKRR